MNNLSDYVDSLVFNTKMLHTIAGIQIGKPSAGHVDLPISEINWQYLYEITGEQLQVIGIDEDNATTCLPVKEPRKRLIKQSRRRG